MIDVLVHRSESRRKFKLSDKVQQAQVLNLDDVLMSFMAPSGTNTKKSSKRKFYLLCLTDLCIRK